MAHRLRIVFYSHFSMPLPSHEASRNLGIESYPVVLMPFVFCSFLLWLPKIKPFIMSSSSRYHSTPN